MPTLFINLRIKKKLAKLKSKIILLFVVIFLFTLLYRKESGYIAFAQNVGINTTGNAPNSSALLDIDASPGNNKGVLIPRLPLTATNVGAPISPAPGVGEKGLMVYNTATAGTIPNDVVPGFYYWNGSSWAPLGGGGSAGGGWTDDGTVVRLTTSTDFVGIGTASPAATSALDITSTTKGILIPRMTTAQRDAIATPATGLQIYNTDCTTLNYWTGTCWISMSKAINDPDAITSVPSQTTFCAGQLRTYSVPAVTGATYYNWSVPAGTNITAGQGTTTINATFGNISGSVCVKARNACETSGQTCIAVNVDPIPNTPGNITGPTSINPGQQSVTYFVASVNGASTYTWSYSGGGFSIASGTGTTTIVVNFSCAATAGSISVTANSTCGASPASSLALTITPLLAASAGAAEFGGGPLGGSPTATGGTTAYTYSWSPATDISSSTAANITALCTGSTTTYTVTVTDSRTCTASSSVVVTRNLTVSAGTAKYGGSTIGGSPTATGGDPTYTYAWSPTSDLSSSTVANPTALCTGSTATYTITVTDANTCTGTSSVIVTRGLAVNAGAAKFGGATIGTVASGGNPTYTYAWNPTTNLSSSTVAVPTALCTGTTTTYTVSATDANSCTATSSVVVTRNLAVNAGAGIFGGTTIGNTATGGNPSYTYAWNPSTGLSNSTLAVPTALCTGSTTTYTVTATDANSCAATSSVVVTRNLTANAGSAQSMVNGCSKTIGGSPTATGGTGAYTYSWSPATGLSSTTVANPASSVGSTTTYTVTVTGDNGCTATSSMTLTISVSTVTFNNTSTGQSGSIQNWTVPGGVTCINIEAWGAQGGTGAGYTGGLGARMKGSFTVTPGQVLKILVGQQGQDWGTYKAGGGGGGTFVTDNSNNPLCIAGGGGGGGGNTSPSNGSPGLTTNDGGNSPCCSGGTAGAGGGVSGGSSGGGGLTGNGTAACTSGPGLSFTNGGTGGVGGTCAAGGGWGGYGGGSGGEWCCQGATGAGGGYSGGAGVSSTGVAGGGGSYNSGASPSNSSGVKSGMGQVVITY